MIFMDFDLKALFFRIFKIPAASGKNLNCLTPNDILDFQVKMCFAS